MKNNQKITIFTLAMINISAVVNIKNLPFMAEYGLSMITYYVLSCLVFLIPCSIVAVELSRNYPESGGIYVWVTRVMGRKVGLLAIWLQWINNIVWIPTQLSFIAGVMAYITQPRLISNKYYLITVILTLLWMSILLNLKGMRVSGLISMTGTIIGTIIPGLIILILAFCWIATGHHSAIEISFVELFPKLNNINNIAFLATMILSFAGIEMSAVHIEEIKNPNLNYPKAILISAISIILIYISGAMSIAIVVPCRDIHLVDGVMQALDKLVWGGNFRWLTKVMAIMIIIGSIATLSTWLIGPAKGFLVASLDNNLPKCLQIVNSQNIPIGIVLIQGLIVSLLSFIFHITPSIESAFWILITLCSQLYALMYVLMFVSSIVLNVRKIKKSKFPESNIKIIGIIFISIIGVLSCMFFISIGFIPPVSLNEISFFKFEIILITGIVFLISPPLIWNFFSSKTYKLKQEKL